MNYFDKFATLWASLGKRNPLEMAEIRGSHYLSVGISGIFQWILIHYSPCSRQYHAGNPPFEYMGRKSCWKEENSNVERLIIYCKLYSCLGERASTPFPTPSSSSPLTSLQGRTQISGYIVSYLQIQFSGRFRTRSVAASILPRIHRKSLHSSELMACSSHHHHHPQQQQQPRFLALTNVLHFVVYRGRRFPPLCHHD